MKAFLRTVLCSTACAGVIMAQGVSHAAVARMDTASAQTTAPTTLTPPRPTENNTALPQSTANQQKITFAAEQMMQHVSRAQLALHLGDKSAAEHHVARAHELATIIKTAAPDQQARTNVQSGIVSYMFNRTKSDYMVPLLEDVEVVKTYTTGPFWSDKEGLAVKDVRAVNVAIRIDPDKALQKLQDAREQVMKNNFDEASDALAQLQRSIVIEEKSVDMPLVEARDNLNLARFMFERNFYDGARYALNHADDSLDKVKATTEERRKRIKDMRAEIQQMSKAIEKKDATIVEKANSKIKGWWEEVKNWAEEKV